MTPAMLDFAARGVPITVVAAVTEKGIVRGVSHFTAFREVYDEVKKAVGVLIDGIEWSAHTYKLPYYAESIGGCSGWDVAGGIYLFPWLDTTKDWRDPKRRYSSETAELLWRPTGWAGGRE